MNHPIQKHPYIDVVEKCLNNQEPNQFELQNIFYLAYWNYNDHWASLQRIAEGPKQSKITGYVCLVCYITYKR